MAGRNTITHERFILQTRWKLLLLALGLAGLWYLAATAAMTPDELRQWERVRAAQLHLSQWRQGSGGTVDAAEDRWNCGLIGMEWSSISTTLGDPSAKRTACNPAWAVSLSRWFIDLGLKPGDPIAIYSSGSFPGFLLSVLVAAEAMELKPLLIVSLGSSSWGANDPAAPWPVLAAELRHKGFIRTPADYYTLGAGAELGQGLSPEGEALLRSAAQEAGVELLTAPGLAEMIFRKTDLMVQHQARLLVSIGGSQANLGDGLEILKLQPGLVQVDEKSNAGNGVIAKALQAGIPVIHMLNVKALSEFSGIPYDSRPRKVAPVKVSVGLSLAGTIIFIIVLWRHRRWKFESASG
jgi:poly-gamma-glutamate system protein